MVNANQNDWDVKLFIALWAYQIVYKIIIHATPFELVYGIQPVMLAEFMVPIHIIQMY
jgi:hypothetical protein